MLIRMVLVSFVSISILASRSVSCTMKKTFLLIISVGIISAIAGFLVSSLSNFAQANFLENFLNRFVKPETPAVPTRAATPTPYRAPVDYEESIIRAVEQAAPAVISIIVTKDLPIIENCPFNPFGDLPPEFRQFFGPFEFQRPCQRGTQEQEVGGGSGFIISSDGLILTNKHVVLDAKASYTVLTNDGKRYEARILARDPVQDLAIAKITAPAAGLPTVKLGDSDSIKLGQTAIAIGNALGEFRNTVSVGIISGLARAINASGGGVVERLEGLIQTDAAINPGNSGGPLLNLRGEVIGVNTAMAQGAENIGFSIPINRAKRDIESVKKTGKITIPFIGIRYLIITPAVKEREQLSVDYGALVRGNDEGPGVVPNSPAARTGIQAEDIILEINGERITPERSLALLLQKYNVGDTVRLKILRAAREVTASVTLTERPQ